MNKNIYDAASDLPIEYQEPEHIDDRIIVDRVECGRDWIRGYKDGEVIATMTGISDISVIQLYNEAGNLVIPAPAPLDEITKLKLALAEIVEGL